MAFFLSLRFSLFPTPMASGNPHCESIPVATVADYGSVRFPIAPSLRTSVFSSPISRSFDFSGELAHNPQRAREREEPHLHSSGRQERIVPVPVPLRVALLYDNKTWVLGTIADQIQRHVARAGVVDIHPLHASLSRGGVPHLLRTHDLVHFLSPGDFYRIGPAVAAPTVITVHHVASRVKVRLNSTGYLADILCPTNAKCHAELEALPGLKDVPMVKTSMGLDTDFFQFRAEGRSELLKRSGAPPETLFLGLAAKKDSNEDDRKGFDRYWALLEELKRKFSTPVRLVIFGPGAEASFGWRLYDIPESIRNLVWMPGFLPLDELPLLYSGLDFYLCLSRIEGGPNPVLESMSCGVKVISTPVGIVPELIEDGKSGFLVNGDNYMEKVPALLADLRNGHLDTACLGIRARESVLQTRSWRAVATTELYLDIYRKAWERYRARPLKDRMARHMRILLASLKRARKTRT